jgi:HSP20 family molecular chaperone IbpA
MESQRWRMLNRPRLWSPPADVYETEDEIFVRLEVAGMREADFAVALYGRLLAISGVRSDVNERRAYHRMEIPFGEFAIEIELPQAVDESRVEAVYTTGFLKIVLPKARPHPIRIEE